MYQVQLCDPNAALKATVDRAFADKEEKQGQGGGGGGGNAVSITGNTHEQQKTLLGVLIGRSLETASNCADSARLWQVLLSLSHALSLFLALSLSLARARALSLSHALSLSLSLFPSLPPSSVSEAFL